MKGRWQFSQTEAHGIRAELLALRRADRTEQKRIRQRIRRQYEFYITDFGFQGRRGFTVADFERLVAAGRIAIR